MIIPKPASNGDAYPTPKPLITDIDLTDLLGFVQGHIKDLRQAQESALADYNSLNYTINNMSSNNPSVATLIHLREQAMGRANGITEALGFALDLLDLTTFMLAPGESTHD